MVRAWRHGLDRDHNDKMDFAEFSSAVRDVGYAGSARELWAELDLNGNGFVSLWALGPSRSSRFQGFKSLLIAF